MTTTMRRAAHWHRPLMVFFDARESLVRMALVVLSGVGYLLLGTPDNDTPAQWVLAVAAFAAGLSFHRRPLVNLLLQTALLAVTIQVVDDVTINQVGARRQTGTTGRPCRSPGCSTAARPTTIWADRRVDAAQTGRRAPRRNCRAAPDMGQLTPHPVRAATRAVLPGRLLGMTGMGPSVRKLSISVPSDVAERLGAETNASAYIVSAVRARMRLEQLGAILARRGMTVTAEGKARAAAALAEAEAEWTPERRAELRERSKQGARALFDSPGDRRASAA
ncbi:hypothetical protein [Micromonospora inyonensis]|nr:hypothetical protein [Micromonospora inyonensis]